MGTNTFCGVTWANSRALNLLTPVQRQNPMLGSSLSASSADQELSVFGARPSGGELLHTTYGILQDHLPAVSGNRHPLESHMSEQSSTIFQCYCIPHRPKEGKWQTKKRKNKRNNSGQRGQREIETDRQTERHRDRYVCMYVCMYIYIYMLTGA